MGLSIGERIAFETGPSAYVCYSANSLFLFVQIEDRFEGHRAAAAAGNIVFAATFERCLKRLIAAEIQRRAVWNEGVSKLKPAQELVVADIRELQRCVACVPKNYCDASAPCWLSANLSTNLYVVIHIDILSWGFYCAGW